MTVQNIKMGTEAHTYVEYSLDLDPADASDNFIYEHLKNGQAYEPDVTWMFLRTLTQEDIVVDVGANVGYFTVLAAKLVGSHGHVFAFEPDPYNIRKLRHNLKINDCEGNVTVIEKAVWSTCEERLFYFNDDTHSSSALMDPAEFIWHIKTRENRNKAVMLTTTLDAEVGSEAVKLVKIDTEGAEQRILEGAQLLLSHRHPPFVVAELNPLGLEQTGCTSRTLRQYMARWGYHLFLPRANGAMPVYVPDETDIAFINDIQVANGVFTTIRNVGLTWPRAYAATDWLEQL